MDTSASTEGGGPEFDRVAALLRQQIKDGRYAPGTWLPPQRVLAPELGVARQTLQRVLSQLAEEGLIEARRGSGTRVAKVPPRALSDMPRPGAGRPSLEPYIRQAFEAPTVSLDVYTLTSENLISHLDVQVERILGAGQIRPEKVRIRMLLPEEDRPLAYPRALDSDDPRIHQRWQSMARRHARRLRQHIDRLVGNGLDARLEIRRVPLTPSFKLYVLNETDMLFGPYEVMESTITLDDDVTRVDAYDVLGTFSTLTYHSASGSEHDRAFFRSMRGWFESNWNLLGTPAPPAQ